MWRESAYPPPPYNYYKYHNHKYYSPPSLPSVVHNNYQGGGRKKTLIAWRCTHCKADHHNPAKKTCRIPNCPGVNPTLPVVAPLPH
eukprot:7415502-Karenia_brevis.AAC.1